MKACVAMHQAITNLSSNHIHTLINIKVIYNRYTAKNNFSIIATVYCKSFDAEKFCGCRTKL